MKRIIFLIIGALMVLGLVLPGCETQPENEIYIAVCGPMTDLQGINMWNGANKAADEINDAGGVTINSTTYTVVLKKVETQESTEGEDGTTGSSHLSAVINNVNFCVGGFRTEVVNVYREVAMNAKKIFMNCGAATGSLQFSVVTDHDKYKYWFKATPYNESFLVTSLLKMTGLIGATLKGTLQTLEATNSTYVKNDYKVSLAVGLKLRVVILMENAAWCAGMVTAAGYYLPLLGYNVTHTILVNPTDSTIGVGNWNTILADKPHIIFTAFSGSVGAVYSSERVSNAVPAVTIGINVPGQQLSHYANTDGDCEGEIMLDTWAVGLNNTPLTSAFFTSFVSTFGIYPVYTAGTYDAIRYVIEAMEATSSFDQDVLVAWLEDPDNMMADSVASLKVGTFPMPDITYNATLYGLSAGLVADYYNLASYGKTYAPDQWECGYNGTTQKPNIAHDLLYGPGYATGIGSQWQVVGSAGQKVGVWPMYMGPSYDVPLTDQYGNWNFAYPGTKDLILTIGGMLNIPWDPYA